MSTLQPFSTQASNLVVARGRPYIATLQTCSAQASKRKEPNHAAAAWAVRHGSGAAWLIQWPVSPGSKAMASPDALQTALQVATSAAQAATAALAEIRQSKSTGLVSKPKELELTGKPEEDRRLWQDWKFTATQYL